jgi:hypothetical protein
MIKASGYAAGLLLVLSSKQICALNNPDLERVNPSIASLACERSGFNQGRTLAKAIQNNDLNRLEPLLSEALREWQMADQNSADYPAKSFCLHQAIPVLLPREKGDTQSEKQLGGMSYTFYDPDGGYLLNDNPVDLEKLATKYPGSPWGQQAFLIMTLFGWSNQPMRCQGGSDQFREVISHSENFLKRFPDTEISPVIRLELAKAYATWWNLSQNQDDPNVKSEEYKSGSEDARLHAIKIFETLPQQNTMESTDPLKHLSVQEVVKALKLKTSIPNYQNFYYCVDEQGD